MGAFAVTSQELLAYSIGTKANLTGWEFEQVIMMSKLYCNYLNIGKKPTPPPYEREFNDEDIAAQNESINKMLAAEEKAFKALKT